MAQDARMFVILFVFSGISVKHRAQTKEGYAKMIFLVVSKDDENSFKNTIFNILDAKICENFA